MATMNWPTWLHRVAVAMLLTALCVGCAPDRDRPAETGFKACPECNARVIEEGADECPNCGAALEDEDPGSNW
jgi:hypothetical protein